MQNKYSPLQSWKISLLIVTVFSVLFCTVTYAENQSQPLDRKLEAWEQAQDYSIAHSVVAFAVYGRTVDSSAQANAQKIQRFLERKNIPSHYFIADENDMGSSIGFYIKGVSYGPIGLAKAKPLLFQVIAHYQEEFRQAS